MRLPSTCCLTCLAVLLLAVPTFPQDNSASANSVATQSTQSGQSAAPSPNPQSTDQVPSAGVQLVRTMEDLRERILLDRIDQLEKRLSELEAHRASTQSPSTPEHAAGEPASTTSSGGSQGPATTPPATTTPAQEPAPASSPTWSEGPIDFSGLVDFYYLYNANHPASQTNQLYNFDVKANQFSLNMAKLSLGHSPDPVGFQVDLGFGRAFDMIHAGEPSTAPSFLRNIEQAYVSLKPAQLKGLEVDFGQFVTSAGAEVIETHSNWNYSRSLLFAWAIPYYHFGLRTSFPVGKHFTGGVQVVNGWNNTEDNNTGKTLGFTGTITTSKLAWSNTYYTGPENVGTNTGWRNLYDTVFLLTPNSKLNAYLNFDYGQNKSGSGFSEFTAKWYGVAGALRFQANGKWAFTPRVEWFKDRDGFSTGGAQDLKEFTFTGEYKMLEGVLGRLEYRHDWSNQPFFDRGGTPASYKSQDTVALGIVGYFGPKR